MDEILEMLRCRHKFSGHLGVELQAVDNLGDEVVVGDVKGRACALLVIVTALKLY